MKIELLYFRGCPNLAPSLQNIRLALQATHLDATIEEIEVQDPVFAQQLAFLGSPSIRINGLDIEPDARAAKTFGFGCRTYSAAGKRTGTPPVDLIRHALLEAIQPQKLGVAE